MLSAINLVLDGKHKGRSTTSHKKIDVPPFASHFCVTECGAHFWRYNRLPSEQFFYDVYQERSTPM
jgi:hypothetical protein